jgi:hypothetical protein
LLPGALCSCCSGQLHCELGVTISALNVADESPMLDMHTHARGADELGHIVRPADVCASRDGKDNPKRFDCRDGLPTAVFNLAPACTDLVFPEALSGLVAAIPPATQWRKGGFLR